MTSITIPNSVINIGENAFYGTAWFDNQPDGVVYAGLVAYIYKGMMPKNTKIVLKDGTKGIADVAFSGRSDLTSVTIPNSVTEIGESAFAWCFGLTSVAISNSVTYIGRDAFKECVVLTSVNISDIDAWCKIKFESIYSNPNYYAHHLCLNEEDIKDISIPNTITSIGNYTFCGCSDLTSVTIPNSVSEIGERAFSGCSSLRDIYSNNVVPPTCGESVFSGVKTANCRLHVPDGSKEEYAFADGWCDFYNILEGEGEGESELEKLKAANEELQKENEALKQEIACYSLGDLNKDGRTDIDDVAVLLGLDAYSSDSDALAMLTEGTCITPAEIQEKYGDVEYYTVDGVKVAEPSQNGIYIVKKNGVTKMIVVKK